MNLRLSYYEIELQHKSSTIIVVDFDIIAKFDLTCLGNLASNTYMADSRSINLDKNDYIRYFFAKSSYDLCKIFLI